MEDVEELEEDFPGAGLGPYLLTQEVQDNNKLLVKAFVNGLKIEVASVTGVGKNGITLVDPVHYSIDGGDEVVIFYQANI
jgi:hypothetical protein